LVSRKTAQTAIAVRTCRKPTMQAEFDCDSFMKDANQ